MSGLGVVPGRYSLRETPSHGTHPLSQPRIALKSRKRYVKIPCRVGVVVPGRFSVKRPVTATPPLAKPRIARKSRNTVYSSRAGARSWALPIPAIIGGNVTGSLCSPRSWALPIPAIIGEKFTDWRPFMGSAHTRQNRRKGHGLAMLATFMGSAHTRHNRRKVHGLASVHGLCPYPP